MHPRVDHLDFLLTGSCLCSVRAAKGCGLNRNRRSRLLWYDVFFLGMRAMLCSWTPLLLDADDLSVIWCELAVLLSRLEDRHKALLCVSRVWLRRCRLLCYSGAAAAVQGPAAPAVARPPISSARGEVWRRALHKETSIPSHFAGHS